MKKNKPSAWWLLILIIALSLALLVVYLSRVTFFGPLNVSSSSGKKIGVLARTPLGTVISYAEGVQTGSADQRFYSRIEVFHPGGPDTLHIQCGSCSQTVIIEEKNFSEILIQKSPVNAYPFYRKICDLFVFASTLRWLKGLALGVVLLISAAGIWRLRKRLLSFAERHHPVRRIMISATSLRGRWMLSTFWALLTCIPILYFGNRELAQSQQVIFDDVVHVKHNPDQIDYQTIAVNQAMGKGFMINGVKDELRVYKIMIDSTENPLNDRLSNHKLRYLGGRISLHRFPAYPAAVGLYYRAFGIHPLGIKILQGLMLFLLVLLFPLMGYDLWKIRGYLAGLLSAPFFFISVFPLIDSVAPDIFTITINFLIIYLYIIFRQKPAWKGLLMLALFSGVSILFKASLMYLIPLILFDLTRRAIIKRSSKSVMQVIAFVVLFTACWLPYNIWSIHTSGEHKANAGMLLDAIEKGTPVNRLQERISAGDFGRWNQTNIKELKDEDLQQFHEDISPYLDQAGILSVSDLPRYTTNSIHLAYNKMAVMHDDYYFMIMLYPIDGGLHCHNEYISDGRENAAWVFDPSSHYNNDGIKGAYWTRRVWNFYLSHPSEIFRIAWTKLTSVIRWAPVTRFAVSFFFLWLGFVLSRNLRSKEHIFLPFVFIIPAAAALFSVEITVPLFFLMLILLFGLRIMRKQIPIPLTGLITCMVLMPLITVAVSRYSTYYFFPLYLLSAWFLLQTGKITTARIREILYRNAKTLKQKNNSTL